MSAPLRLAVLGDPIAHSRSPELHRAGGAAVGVVVESTAIRTDAAQLPARLAELAAAGYRGVNLTTPLKAAALACIARGSARALAARSVNTVTFAPDGAAGDSTDGAGFVDWLAALGTGPGTTLLVLGAGGAARSAARAAITAGFRTRLCARDPARAAQAWGGGARPPFVAWRESDVRAALADSRVAVNATPLGRDADAVPAAWIPPGTLVLDMNYAREPGAWITSCRAAGLAAHDGLGLLVLQARHSLSHWLGTDVPIPPLAASVGWSR